MLFTSELIAKYLQAINPNLFNIEDDHIDWTLHILSFDTESVSVGIDWEDDCHTWYGMSKLEPIPLSLIEEWSKSI